MNCGFCVTPDNYGTNHGGFAYDILRKMIILDGRNIQTEIGTAAKDERVVFKVTLSRDGVSIVRFVELYDALHLESVIDAMANDLTRGRG